MDDAFPGARGYFDMEMNEGCRYGAKRCISLSSDSLGGESSVIRSAGWERCAVEKFTGTKHFGERIDDKGMKPPPHAPAENLTRDIDHATEVAVGAPRITRALSSEVLRTVADEVKAYFVRTPEKPELVLIEIDPHRLHAFWTISREAMEMARTRLGDDGNQASMILRVFEHEENGAGSPKGASFDADVGGLQSRSYVDVFGEARRYQAEIGLRSADNRFVTLAASNPVELPPASSQGSNGFLQLDMKNPEAGTLAPQPTSPGHDAPPPLVFLPETAQGHDILGMGDSQGMPSGTEAHSGVGSPAAPPPLVLEEALTSSSYGLGRSGGFEVTAELHLFGQADPEQDLHLFGRKIPLRPDGSFSIRHILPNDPTVVEALMHGGEPSTDRGGD